MLRRIGRTELRRRRKRHVRHPFRHRLAVVRVPERRVERLAQGQRPAVRFRVAYRSTGPSGIRGILCRITPREREDRSAHVPDTLVTQPMRRSAQVAAPLLASTALALLSGCHQAEMQRCVDENNKVVDDKLCANQPADAAQQRQMQEQQRQHNGIGILPFIPLYHYYYGGYGGRGIGSAVTGGTNTPLAGHSYSNSTTRGGFGRSFSQGGAHGGEGSGGGHGGGAGE